MSKLVGLDNSENKGASKEKHGMAWHGINQIGWVECVDDGCVVSNGG